MSEYLPKRRKPGMNMPFGYYIHPTDADVLLPDPKKLDALHYAFRMKAKYGTSLRDCTMWLHSACGQRISAPGFMYAYKHWMKSIGEANRVKVKKRKKDLIKAREKFIAENFKQFGIKVDDGEDITAVAINQAAKARKKQEQAKHSAGQTT